MSQRPVLFIVGAESFVGKNLIRHCQSRSIPYRGIDLIESSDPNVHKVDICDPSLADEIPADSVVVHLAAISRDSDCSENPGLANKINIEGTLNVLRCAQIKNARQMIFASSEWVYGQVSNDAEQSELDEIQIHLLDSIYAITKAVGERYLKLLRKDLDVTVLRFAIIYGPRPSNWSAVESLFDSVKNKAELSVGSLRAGRRFIHIDDICTGILAAVGLPGYEILNISGDNTVTLGEIIMQSKSITGRSPEVLEVAPEKVSLRNPTNKKAKSVLNWSPKISITDGLRSLLSN